MTWKEKYAFLYTMYDSFNTKLFIANLDIVKKLSEDRSPEIRSLVAKLCSIYDNPVALDLLLQLSSDSNSIVRTEVADSLSSFSEDIAYQKLILMCNDSYYLTRGYAECSLGIVGNAKDRKDETIKIIQKKMVEEKRFFNRINCNKAMYYLDSIDAIEKILSIYHKLGYRDKCVVINFMIEILSVENSQQILPFFKILEKSGELCVDVLVDKLLSIDY